MIDRSVVFFTIDRKLAQVMFEGLRLRYPVTGEVELRDNFEGCELSVDREKMDDASRWCHAFFIGYMSASKEVA